MLIDIYDVFPLPVNISDEIRKQNPHFKSFVAAYFPAEMLNEMKWTDKTKLQLTIEKDGLKIIANDSGIENFLTNELIYVPLDEDDL